MFNYTTTKDIINANSSFAEQVSWDCWIATNICKSHDFRINYWPGTHQFVIKFREDKDRLMFILKSPNKIR